MNRERQTILSLVALGRITPRDGERLLAASNAGGEEMWVIGACVAAGVAQFLPDLAGLAHALLPALHHVVVGIAGGI